ncbi:MAG: hypothetical protein NC338_01635 [Firmicutes bacterium]|nr:hypothetical protein [Bacillota bacterium]MCM1401093.1 hypothetical protein [Bacteroides sp.]MCM1477012.1 hypothetical protein [Bacteroides sp.]
MKFLEVDLDSQAVEVIADSALTLPGRPLFIPDLPEVPRWTLRPLLAVRVSRLGKCISPKFAHRYRDAITVVLRLLPSVHSGISSLIDCGINLGSWMEASQALSAPELPVEALGQSVTLTDVHALIDRAIAWVSRGATLKMGDVLLLPISAIAPAEVHIGFNTAATLCGQPVLNLRIR